MSKKKVLLGMSGGVDSSVAAALLLEQGYEVIGCTMQIWPDKGEEIQKNEGGCCSLSAVDDARRVANKLGIAYYVLNFKDLFQEKVIDYFKDEYFKGRTPNPCIACNKHLKFDALLNKAISMGIDYVSTGHYATVDFNNELNRYVLRKSITDKKDQTYALYTFTQEQLSKTLMPIGTYTKEQIRDMAKSLGLGRVANKPDSQEICFIEDNNYGRYLEENSNLKIIPGNFVDKNGNILGVHKGIIYYTIGQRKGLGLSFGKPVFVVDIDTKNNTIVLGDDTEVFSNKLIACDMNYITIDKLSSSIRTSAKVRYGAKEAFCDVIPLDGNKVEVIFDQPQRAITPGQSVVFYDKDLVVGGGIIER